MLSHRRRCARVLQLGSAGNTKRYCNAGTDSLDGSWTHRYTVGTSSHTVVPKIFRNWSVPHWVSQISTNLLPARVVEPKNVEAMQHELQCLMKFRAVNRLNIRCTTSRDSVVTSSDLFSAAASVLHDVESVSLRSAPIAWGTAGAVGFFRWTLRKPVTSKAPPVVTPRRGQREDASKFWREMVWRRRL